MIQGEHRQPPPPFIPSTLRCLRSSKNQLSNPNSRIPQTELGTTELEQVEHAESKHKLIQNNALRINSDNPPAKNDRRVLNLRLNFHCRKK